MTKNIVKQTIINMNHSIIIILAIILFNTNILFAQTGNQRDQTEQPQVNQQPQEGEAWQRSEEPTWRGADNVWYKRDGEVILSSTDGKTWTRTENNRFQSMDGTWYQYKDGSLKKSTDGKKWEDTEDWSDQDGRSFRFDEQGRLNTRGRTGE
jgi:hypothetical protein